MHTMADHVSKILTQVSVVVVDQHWYAAVWAVFCEPWLFLNVLSNVDAFGKHSPACHRLLFNSSRMIDALCPFGVPNVSSSRPLFAIGPLGFDILSSSAVVDMCLIRDRQVKLMRCELVCWRRTRGVRNMKVRSMKSTSLNSQRIARLRSNFGLEMNHKACPSLRHCLEA